MNEDELIAKEARLAARLQRANELEAQILRKEKAKKQVLLRLAPSLWDEIAAWAEEDFRSINAQIEYLLTEAVRNRRKGK